MKYGLKDKTIESINKVLSHCTDIESAILYGSRAKGNYRTGSDIDLVVKGNNLDLNVLFKVINDLDELYLPYTIDISIYNQISNEDLIDHIKRVGKVFYKKAHGNIKTKTA